jgi:hypothetical protein
MPNSPALGAALPAPHYQVFVLRLWLAQAPGANGPAVWHLSLEDLLRRQRQGFTSLPDLVDFLQAQLDTATPQPAAP